MDLREIGCEDVDWIHLAQVVDKWWAVVNTVMNHRVSEGLWLVVLLSKQL
jgi:hypothetical protein